MVTGAGGGARCGAVAAGAMAGVTGAVAIALAGVLVGAALPGAGAAAGVAGTLAGAGGAVSAVVAFGGAAAGVGVGFWGELRGAPSITPESELGAVVMLSVALASAGALAVGVDGAVVGRGKGSAVAGAMRGVGVLTAGGVSCCRSSQLMPNSAKTISTEAMPSRQAS